MPTVDTILKLIESTSGAYGTGASNNTPVSLAKEMINKLDVDWSDPTKTFIDPFCGYGTFLVVAYGKLREHGHSPKHIVNNMLFGNDISKTKATIASSVLCKLAETDVTIYNEDFLGSSYDIMKNKDVVIGNPPFQEIQIDGKRKDQASNLWSKFWSKSLSESEKTSTIALISPISWLSPSSDLKGEYKVEGKDRLWDCFDQYDSYAETNVSHHFPGVGSTFGYCVVNKSKKGKLKFSGNQNTSLGFMPLDKIDFCIENLSKTNNLKTNFGILQRNNGSPIRVSIPITRTLKDDSFEILVGNQRPTKGSDKEGLYFYIPVPTMNEAILVQSRLIECKDILSKYCKWSGFVNAKIVELIRYP